MVFCGGGVVDVVSVVVSVVGGASWLVLLGVLFLLGWGFLGLDFC